MNNISSFNIDILTLLLPTSRLIHKGLRECFEKDYERLFDVPQHTRTDNDVSGPSPIYIPAAG